MQPHQTEEKAVDRTEASTCDATRKNKKPTRFSSAPRTSAAELPRRDGNRETAKPRNRVFPRTFALALALGFVLIALAIAVNLAIHALSRTEREGRW